MRQFSKYIDIIVYSFFSFIIGFLTCGVLLQWDTLAATFLDVKITELIQIAITLILGCFIAYQLTIKSSKLIKRNDVVAELFKSTQDKVVLIYNNCGSYMSTPKNSDTKDILIEFKRLSIQLSLISTIIENEKLKITPPMLDITIQYLQLKALVTGNNFGEKHVKYSERDIREFDSIYETLMNKFFLARISLYY